MFYFFIFIFILRHHFAQWRSKRWSKVYIFMMIKLNVNVRYHGIMFNIFFSAFYCFFLSFQRFFVNTTIYLCIIIFYFAPSIMMNKRLDDTLVLFLYVHLFNHNQMCFSIPSAFDKADKVEIILSTTSVPTIVQKKASKWWNEMKKNANESHTHFVEYKKATWWRVLNPNYVSIS